MRHLRGVPILAAARLGVFDLGEARACGWTTDALRHAVSRGHLVRYRPGVYGVPQPTPARAHDAARQRIATAAVAIGLANPSAVVSHTAAAVLHDLPLWHLPEQPCLTVAPRFVGDIEGAHLHRAGLPDGHRASGVVGPTSVGRTLIDIGREDGRLSAVVAADAALRAGSVDAVVLRRLVRDCRGWPGVRAARDAIELADERSESPLESASRFKLRERIPAPELQASVFDLHGNFLGRPDFLWDEFGVAGEADGMLKYDEDPDRISMRKEKRRQEALEQAGLIVVRWGRSDLANLDQLVHRLERAFARGRHRAGPRRWIARLRPKAA